MSEHAQLDPEVIEMLLEDLPVQHRLFQQALAQGDTNTAREQVHSIAGAAAFCKFIALADAARAIEMHLHMKDVIPPGNALKEMEQTLVHVIDTLVSQRENPKENDHG